jgi:hypothetical protein
MGFFTLWKTLKVFQKTLHAVKQIFRGFSQRKKPWVGFVICVGEKTLKNHEPHSIKVRLWNVYIVDY